MKKNVMMRAASALLVAVLLTTCAISSTFAKYITSADSSDVARVAKWGVEIGTTGSLFTKTYAKDAEVEDTAITNTVESSNDDEVVAPGTKNETGITFTIKGTPEVAVKLDIAVTDKGDNANPKDVVLKAGTYADLTTGTSTTTENGTATISGNDDKFTLDTDYYPIVYTLKNNKGTVLKTGNLAAIETYFEGLSDEYPANKDLAEINGGDDGTYTLTWAWQFNTNDKADTFLGAVAAGDTTNTKKGEDLGTAVADGTDYCLTPNFKISITATQID